MRVSERSFETEGGSRAKVLLGEGQEMSVVGAELGRERVEGMRLGREKWEGAGHASPYRT